MAVSYANSSINLFRFNTKFFLSHIHGTKIPPVGYFQTSRKGVILHYQ